MTFDLLRLLCKNYHNMDSTEKQPNFETDIPSYFPVHLRLRVNTEFSDSKLLNVIDDRIATVRRNTEVYLSFLIENPHLLHNSSCEEYLNKQVQAYKKLLVSKCRLHALQMSLKSAHREFVESRRQELDLSLDNYYVYKDVTKQNFADKIVAELSESDGANDFQADSSFLFLKNALFVLQNPEDPLPDDVNDDDVAVAGGKISLKDPLSLNYFVQPVTSRKCNHAFEKQHIMRLIRESGRVNCPVTGCSAIITKEDLEDDKLMALRVKAFLAQTERRDQPLVVRI